MLYLKISAAQCSASTCRKGGVYSAKMKQDADLCLPVVEYELVLLAENVCLESSDGLAAKQTI